MNLVPHWLIALVALQRLGELALSRRHMLRLLARGGREIGAGHYPALVAVHVAWIATLWTAVPADEATSLPWLALYLALQAARIWVMTTLGPYWTTRVIHVPDAPLIRSGPYRFCRHPNYAVVAGEIAVLPMVFGRWPVAIVFSLLNAAILAWRIRVENAALAARP